MNTLRTSSWSQPVRQLSYLVLCAAGLTGSALADQVAAKPSVSTLRVEISAPKANKSPASWAVPAMPTAWASSELVPDVWQRPAMTVLRHPADLLGEDHYLVSTSDFDTRTLFRTRKEMKYRDTLRLLLTKRQLRVWLRDDLHVQCEIKRYRSLENEGRELGLKLGVYYRFQ